MLELVGWKSLSLSPSYEYLMHREGRTEDGVWGVGCAAAAEIIVVQTNIPEKCKEQGLIRLGAGLIEPVRSCGSADNFGFIRLHHACGRLRAIFFSRPTRCDS